MRVFHAIVALICLYGASVPVRLLAQTPATATPAQPASPMPPYQSGVNQWNAAGFVGANSGDAVSSASIDFGGQVAYLHRRMIGGEFIADFTPRFRQDNLFLGSSPNVNAYMANVIGALPLGDEGMIQPFVSGGLGAVQMRSDILNIATFPSSGSNSVSTMRGGANIGGGVMWFAGRIGLRGDVRYYRAFTDTSPGADLTDAEAFAHNLLSGLEFWRTNVGVAFRW